VYTYLQLYSPLPSEALQEQSRSKNPNGGSNPVLQRIQ
jgi:hypothetical protein